MHLRTLESRAFLALVLLVSLLFLWMVRGFLEPVFWAAVLAILFRPTHRGWLEVVRGRRNVASVLTLLTVVVVVLVPTALLGMAVTQEAVNLYTLVATGAIDLYAPIAWAERWMPAVTDLLERGGVDPLQVRTWLQEAAVAVGQFVASQALALGQNAALFTVLFALMLYFLYFFVRDGERIVEGIVQALPLGDVRERRLLAKFVEVTRATVKGTLVVAAVQGALGGLAFWVLGLEAPVFWGVIMAVLSLLPAVGTFLVWGPAGLILIATGSVIRGLILIAFGTFVISVVDNILRPILVGRDTQMPDYLILLATLGGLAVFGLSGFVIGPVIAALFLVVWDMAVEEYGRLDPAPPAAPEPPRLPPPEGAPEEAPEEGGEPAEERRQT